MMSDKQRPHSLYLLVALLLAAFALRLFRLDFQSLWWDEGISLHLATSSWAEIIRDRLDNIHPPLYFFLLKGWLALVGVSPFTGRYLSALASLTQVALVFTAVRHWSGNSRRTALPWIGGVLMLLSPLSVIYGQEIRVYAMLPLIYIAALLLAGRLMVADKVGMRLLVYLAVIEWIGLHLHYIVVFGVAYIALWGLVTLLRQRDWVGARRWIVAHIVVAVACLPWLIGVAVNWAAVQAEAGAGTFTTDPVPLSYLLSQVWVFHLTGLAGSLADGFVRLTAGATAFLTVGLIAYHILRSRRLHWSAVSMLSAHWLVPLLAALFVWNVRSFSHPRYIAMFAAMLVPLVAFLVYPARHWAGRLASLALAMGVVSLSLYGLGHYFFDPATAKPDIRGVASYLESVTVPGDVVFIPDTDWSLPFEYSGEAAVLMPHLPSSPHDPASLLFSALDCTGEKPCAETGRVYTVEYPRSMRDWQGRLPFELERRGFRLGVTPFNDVSLREYRLSQRPGPLLDCGSPDLTRPAVLFDGLHLESAWVEQGAASDTAVAVALCWRMSESGDGGSQARPYRAGLMLRDPLTGERVSQLDTTLLNDAGATAEHWQPGEVVVTYHLLPLSLGTPPAEMALGMVVYREDDATMTPLEGLDAGNNPVGRLIPLGPVALSPPVGLDPSPYDAASPLLWEMPIEMANGLQLIGVSLDSDSYRPGQAIRIGLTWRSTADSLPDLRPLLRLEQNDAVLAENSDAPANGRYPTDRWQRGEIVHEYRDVRIPAGVEGKANLAIVVDGRVENLGEVTISGSEVLFEQPAVQTAVDARFEHGITLIGVDSPPETVTTAGPLPITLYWNSSQGAIPTSYTVFVHLVGEDGALIAQHDALPDNGRRPTDEWLPGEFIIDPHELAWRDPDYRGWAQLIVGLYDSTTGRRLTTADGSDSYRLPFTIRVEATP